MKKLIASLTILATGAALASSVSSSTTFGVLKITSSAKETAISVPWVSAGSSGLETIKVKDFVKTSNLTGVAEDAQCANADILLVYVPGPNGGSYKGWYLNSSTGWKGLNISYNGINTAAGDKEGEGENEDTLLQRGQALILIRYGTEEQIAARTDPNIYLYGQYKDPSGVSYTITRAEGRTTLFAPINTSSTPVNFNTGIEWTNATTGDQIRMQGADGKLRVFTFDSTKNEGSQWGRKGVETAWVTTGTVIQPGQGAWYVTTSGEGGDVTATLKQQ